MPESYPYESPVVTKEEEPLEIDDDNGNVQVPNYHFYDHHPELFCLSLFIDILVSIVIGLFSMELKKYSLLGDTEVYYIACMTISIVLYMSTISRYIERAFIRPLAI